MCSMGSAGRVWKRTNNNFFIIFTKRSIRSLLLADELAALADCFPILFASDNCGGDPGLWLPKGRTPFDPIFPREIRLPMKPNNGRRLTHGFECTRGQNVFRILNFWTSLDHLSRTRLQLIEIVSVACAIMRHENSKLNNIIGCRYLELVVVHAYEYELAKDEPYEI